MAKFDYRTVSSVQRDQLLNEFAQAISKIKSTPELKEFLQHFFTPSEGAMLGRRWQVAKKLVAGISYLDIKKELKIGISTITAVDHWLLKAVGDYRLIVGAISDTRKKNQPLKATRRSMRDIPGTFGDIRHRYQLPFLLINLLLEPALTEPPKIKNRPKKKTAK
jgi:uncharacterized protein YerC